MQQEEDPEQGSRVFLGTIVSSMLKRFRRDSRGLIIVESKTLSMQLEDTQRFRGVLEEPWQAAHREAMRASHWDFLVARCLQIAENVDLGWEITCRDALAGEVPDWQERAGDLRSVFEGTLEAARNTREKARVFASTTGHAIERLQDLAAVIEDLERKAKNYLFRLSLLDPAVIEQAVAEHAEGHYSTPVAALADLLAARHAERITPDYSPLRQWAEQSEPPAAWYEESDSPL